MRLKNLITVLCFLIFISCNQSVIKNILTTQKYDVHVVLLAGQSNMAGCANYDELEDDLKKRIRKAGERVSLVINGKPAQPLTHTFSEYQKNKRGFGNVFGPELFLGLTLAEKYPNQNFLFIKKSQGGTALHGAWNPEWTAEKAAAVEKKGFKRDLQLYNQHHQQIKEQLAILEKAGKTYKIVCLFWMQGENDAAKEIAARSYESNLKKLIEGYRTEFNEPSLPFVMGQINSAYGKFRKEGPEIVRTAMVNISQSEKNVAVIKTSMDRSWKDFPKHDDNVHYNHIGQMRLGIAFAEKWIALQK